MFPNLLFLFLIFCGIISLVTGTVNWEDCGTTVKVTDLRITGCTIMPCLFYEDKEYILEFDAILRTSSKHLPYSVSATIVFPINLVKGDACDELAQGECPILANGKPFTFHKNFTVDLPLPMISKVDTTIKAEMKDDFGITLVCANLKIRILSKALDPNPIQLTSNQSGGQSFMSGFFSLFS